MQTESTIKKGFTINQFRTTEEIESYHKLFEEKIFNAIEIFYPYDRDEDAFKLYTQNLKNLTKYNQEVVLHLPHGRKNSLLTNVDKDVIIQRFKDAIDYGKTFGVKKFTLHLGYVEEERHIEIQKIISILKDLCSYAYPSYIMIENMPRSSELGYSPEEIKEIIKLVNVSNLKFIFDTGHANVSEFESSHYLTLLKDELMHVHINDNNGSKDQHARIGTGNIDFNKFLQETKDYTEIYCLEILYKTVDDLILYANDLEDCKNNKHIV